MWAQFTDTLSENWQHTKPWTRYLLCHLNADTAILKIVMIYFGKTWGACTFPWEVLHCITLFGRRNGASVWLKIAPANGVTYCNSESNDRGLRLLEFVSYNNLVLTNTFGQHKASRTWTWHSPSGEHHNQIDYIMVKRRFQSSVKIGKTRTFPGADIGSDHDLVMMTFCLHLKRVKKQESQEWSLILINWRTQR